MIEPGDIIAQKYKIEHTIYTGGMGVACLSTNIHTNKKYVIKYPVHGQDTKVEKLKVEAAILKSISHPFIVTYIDSFEENNMFYLVTEYIPGRDMKTLFYERPAPESNVTQYANQLLSALEYLHNNNTIHRDIKPRNIMITKNTIKLIDFGGAKKGFTSLEKDPLWTPGYGAPEQRTGAFYYQSDIYAVGATMYFLVTGCDPRHLPPLKPRRKNLQVSKGLDAVIQKATDMDPDKRFQTATEMKKALSGIVTASVSPRLILGSKQYTIGNKLTIGRGGSKVHPDVTIDDPNRFLSKIHARIIKDTNNNYWVEDYSANGTFIQKDGNYKRIKKWNLTNNDVIALCWNPVKGPYIVGKFKVG
ncbi:MAG: FHA domain-containing serine/threonine-protein kinase [Candidatus Methanofastidiosia archaeon]|jgi:serine/threonine-protein kinase